MTRKPDDDGNYDNAINIALIVVGVLTLAGAVWLGFITRAGFILLAAP